MSDLSTYPKVIIVCPTSVDFRAMSDIATSKGSMVFDSRENREILPTWLYQMAAFRFENSKYEFRLINFSSGDQLSFTVNLTLMVSKYRPDFVGMIGTCTGRLLGTIYYGLRATNGELTDVIGQRQASEQ